MSLQNKRWEGRSVRHSLLSAAALLALCTATPSRVAAAPVHCRDIEFNGAAGAASQDVVTFRVRDSAATLLDESCAIQVFPNEAADDFTARLPFAWGQPDTLLCPYTLNLPPPNPLPKSWCSTQNGYSCKKRVKTRAAKPKADPPLPAKKYVRVCCFESIDCKGPKIGRKTGKPLKLHCTAGLAGTTICTVDTDCDSFVGSGDGRCGRKPVTIQSRVDQPNFIPDDSELPSIGGITPVVIDPIGMTQRPFRNAGSCRSALASKLKRLTSTTIKSLVRCYKYVLNGTPLPNCNLITPDPEFPKDPRYAIQPAIDSLRETAQDVCAPKGSPLRLGYKTCPAPCASQLNTCTAGLFVGQPCSTHTDCDYYGYGHCGGANDWTRVANCLACLETFSSSVVIADLYGAAGPPTGLSPEAVKCQNAIGTAYQSLVDRQLGETNTCQVAVDAGIKNLPGLGACKAGMVGNFCSVDQNCDNHDGVCSAPYCIAGNYSAMCNDDRDCDTHDGRCTAGYCKNEDLVSHRANAETAATKAITNACLRNDVDYIDQLDSCAGYPNDVADEAMCVINGARAEHMSIADGVFPEGQQH